jgi:hypothetical protein
MLSSEARLTVAAGIAAVLLALPSEGEAGLFDWMCPTSSSAPVVSTTTYMPAYTSYTPACTSCTPACSSCTPAYTSYMPARPVARVSLMPTVATTSYLPVAQTCQYTPQISYRWRYSRMPVTSYRPVTAVDPCTGCASVAYRPVTRMTLLPWFHREPYTAYRLSCSPVCPTSSTSACYGCSLASCTPSYCCPTSTAGIGAGSSCPAGCAPISTPPSTFKTEETTDRSAPGGGEPEQRLKPTPDLNSSPASTRAPVRIRPENRTAARPVQYAAYYRPIQRTPPTSPRSGAPLDVSGWHASHD